MPRKVEFIGGPRLRVSATELIRAWRKTTQFVPAEYACGTAQHESDFTLNEVDTEPNGFVSKGIFQLADSESRTYGMAQINLLTLDGSCAVMAEIARDYIERMAEAAKIKPPFSHDMLAYVHIAHNQGIGAALKSIRRHGLDWEEYKGRNSRASLVAIRDAANDVARAAAREKQKWWEKVYRYGDDCITGGPMWPEKKPTA